MGNPYKNTRFDPDVIEFHSIAKEMAKSVGYTADLSIEPQLAQLLRLRVAQIYPCSYCLILHTKAAHDDLSSHFNERAIAEITALIINMNLWTRLKLAQGQVPDEE